MPTPTRFAEIATLAGDPSRAAMLHALLDGRALTAGELSRAAGISAQTASGHLTRLVAAGLVIVRKQGRHRYHSLGAPEVAQMLESIMQAAAAIAHRGPALTVGPKDAALRAARTCYDHLAGRLGVAIADALVAAGHVHLGVDGGEITASGLHLLDTLGLHLDPGHNRSSVARSGRLLCRPCLDWSERRPHIAGVLGTKLCGLALADGWIRRVDESRAVKVTAKGAAVFRDRIGVAAQAL